MVLLVLSRYLCFEEDVQKHVTCSEFLPLPYSSAGMPASHKLWDMLCPDLQDRIVGEVVKSASLLRLHTLSRMCSSFAPAYTSRLAAQHSNLLQAGPQLPSVKMLPSLLALLHRHMTGHPLLHAPCASVMRCTCCTFPRGAHVRNGKWPWLLRCPSVGGKRPAFSWCFVPDVGELDAFLDGFMFTGKLHMLCDGSLEDLRSEHWH